MSRIEIIIQAHLRANLLDRKISSPLFFLNFIMALVAAPVVVLGIVVVVLALVAAVTVLAAVLALEAVLVMVLALETVLVTVLALIASLAFLRRVRFISILMNP